MRGFAFGPRVWGLVITTILSALICLEHFLAWTLETFNEIVSPLVPVSLRCQTAGLAPEVNLPLGMLGNSPDLLHCGRAITEVRKAGGWGGGSFGERVKGSCVVRWKWTLCHRAGIKLRKRQPEARRYDNHPWQPDRAPMQSQFIEFGLQAPSLPTVDHAHPGPPEVCMLWLTPPTLGYRKYARCGSPHPPWATGSMHAVAQHTHPGSPEVCKL